MDFGYFIKLTGLVKRLPAFAGGENVYAGGRAAAKPRAQLVPFAQMDEVFPCGDERLLREVLALPEIARGAVSERGDERLIARNNLAKGVAVARQGSHDQFRVVVCCDRHKLGRHHIVAYVAGKSEQIGTAP